MPPNLADPAFEPSDEELEGLLHGAFGAVRATRDEAQRQVRESVQKERARGLRERGVAQPARPERSPAHGPVLLIVAGPNGAGKTTLTDRLRRDGWGDGLEFLNTHELARDRFGGWNDPEALHSAAAWAGQRRDELLAARASLAIETVFSAVDKVDFIERARAVGYFVRLLFVGTESPILNASRVARRVLAGGPSVPLEKIVGRYARSMANLSAALPLAQRADVFDNSVDFAEARPVLRAVDGVVRRMPGVIPDWAEDAAAFDRR